MSQPIGVIGAGTMGAGIAQVAAAAGSSVVLYDVRRELAEKGVAGIATGLTRLVDRGKMDRGTADATVSRITASDRLGDLASAAIVIEAAPEKLELKRALFGELGSICAPDAILASNTSSLSIGKIAEAVPRSERVAGMHFFNPAPILPLVEVIRGAKTSDSVMDRLVETACAWGKTPVRVRDTPGFIVNRVARPYYLEALRMLEEEVAPIETIDAALEGAGFRMGPGRLLDLIGMDVNWDVTNAVWEGFGRNPRFEPHPIQKALVDAGRLGRKTGRGFYSYADGDGRSGDPTVDTALAAAIVLRTVGCLVNEAALALGDAIASADDIDLAMKLGTNYPKGPLTWGAEIGTEKIVASLRRLAENHPERYPIAPRLLEGKLR